ncbi:hypothetical protein FNV43_RR14284 [Rhamnella rubrinervis]|uniref:Cytochrome P450 n=1 Tax=Rhamnella rubrinervis TaxID=2594499 RepID=A0A8K0MG67_9ROSA|nr:hypothetical protein FNV43_RR14284 [Rhamnella rubrinervis]
MLAPTNSYKFLRDTAFNFIVAGRDTVSAGFAWFLWLVAIHPVVETKILQGMRDQRRDENDDRDGGLVFDAQQVRKLVYLQTALCETLRPYPPVPRNHKAPSQPDTLTSGHLLNRNQIVLLSYYEMGRMEGICVEDCLEFKPERWINIDSDGVRSVVHVAATSFRHLMQMKMVAASMLWNYRVKVLEERPVSPSISVILYMKQGLKVSFVQEVMKVELKASTGLERNRGRKRKMTLLLSLRLMCSIDRTQLLVLKDKGEEAVSWRRGSYI